MASFSTMSISPSPPLITASPMQRLVVDRARWPRRPARAACRRAGAVRPPAPGRGPPGPRMARRVLHVQAAGWASRPHPPVPMKPPVEKRSRPASSASAVVFITWSIETPCGLHARRVDLHLEHLDALAPDRHVGDARHPSSRARIFQYEIIDIWIVDSESDDRPIFMTRLVDDSGWMMNGGLAHVGSCVRDDRDALARPPDGRRSRSVPP